MGARGGGDWSGWGSGIWTAAVRGCARGDRGGGESGGWGGEVWMAGLTEEVMENGCL